MAGMADMNYPVPEEKLEQIAQQTCESALGEASDYDHDQTESWNQSIINNFLKALLSESPSSSDSSEAPPKRYKYAITSTVIQHLDSPSTASTGTTTEGESSTTNGDVQQRPTSARRGMHSATGAYWNNETDGMWTYKWEGAEKRGCDVVISVIWVMA